MKSAVGNSRNEKFLNELEQIVLTNLQNEQFSVENLARQKGISRSHLHRRLKQLKGKSVSQFIREIRLKKAMALLQKDVADVSEIAYGVGFNSTSYFNTCFHSFYGYPPGEVKKRIQYSGDNKEVKTIIERNDFDLRTNLPEPDENQAIKKTLNSGKSKSRKYFLNGSLLVVVIVLIFYYFNLQGGNKSKYAIKSIAILPLNHLSNNVDQEYLTAGIHDALIGELGTIKAFSVRSATSSLHFADRKLNMQDIAKELKVNYIVEGSVLILGDSLRIQLQLIEVFPEERHIWAQDYYQDISNILQLQGKVIEDIAKTIKIQLTDEEMIRLTSKSKVNPETYKAYLRGMHYLNKSKTEEFKKGLEYLHKAIEEDPADPYAYAGLAEGYVTLGHGPNPSNIYWKRAKMAALRAIELDSTMARAYATLASIKLYFERDWKGAERAFIHTNALNNNIAVNHFHYAWYHVLFGQLDQAVKENKLAKELDPLSPINTADLGSIYYWMGEYDRAIIELELALELDKNFGHAWWSLGNVYVEKGMYDKAIEAHLKAVEINLEWKWALADTYVLSGHLDKAQIIVSELKTKPMTPRTAFGLMKIHVSLGDIDEAFYWLNHQPTDFWIPWIRTWPGFEALRKDSRFNKFLQEKNLPPLQTPAT